MHLQEQSVVQKGLYQCRVDATGLVKGKGWAKGAPLFKSVVAQVGAGGWAKLACACM